MEHTSLIRDTQ